MIEGLIKYASVYFFSIFKFIAGPTLGFAAGLTVFETALLTVLGMMTSVILLTLVGDNVRDWIRVKLSTKRFSKGNRRFVSIWKKYGVFGVSFLTPIIFTPIGGTLLVNVVGGSKKKILTYMLASAIFWSVALSMMIRQMVLNAARNAESPMVR